MVYGSPRKKLWCERLLVVVSGWLVVDHAWVMSKWEDTMDTGQALGEDLLHQGEDRAVSSIDWEYHFIFVLLTLFHNCVRV